MATYTPTSTSYPNGVVLIESEDSTLYDTIQESISGSHNYLINSIYLKTNDVSQILEPITFQKYDSNGDIQNDKNIPTVDPFSFQPAVSIDFSKKDGSYILDGQTEIGYTLQANESVYFYLNTTVVDNGSLLPEQKGFNEEFLKTYDFFQEYDDKINIDFNYEQAGVPEGYNEKDRY